MTKHYFSTPEFDVELGWDRRLQYFYLNVYRKPGDPQIQINQDEAGEDDTDPRLAYCSLHDLTLLDRWRNDVLMQPSPTGGLTLGELKSRLLDCQVMAPEGLFEVLEDEQHRNVGNATRTWTTTPTSP